MAKLDIDTDYIAKLAELLQRTGLTEIEISEGDARVRVVKKHPPMVEVPVAVKAPTSAMTPSALAPESVESAPADAVTSPMVGTVYLSPEPGAPPFVSTGEVVKEGQTLLVIEAMKVMNQIRAPKAGRVGRVFCANATPVEYGEPLLVIEPV